VTAEFINRDVDVGAILSAVTGSTGQGRAA
jgi:hypothetical protein